MKTKFYKMEGLRGMSNRLRTLPFNIESSYKYLQAPEPVIDDTEESTMSYNIIESDNFIQIKKPNGE